LLTSALEGYPIWVPRFGQPAVKATLPPVVLACNGNFRSDALRKGLLNEEQIDALYAGRFYLVRKDPPRTQAAVDRLKAARCAMPRCRKCRADIREEMWDLYCPE
jgi:hypothetical protein